jgi:hypothetical protein
MAIMKGLGDIYIINGPKLYCLAHSLTILFKAVIYMTAQINQGTKVVVSPRENKKKKKCIYNHITRRAEKCCNFVLLHFCFTGWTGYLSQFKDLIKAKKKSEMCCHKGLILNSTTLEKKHEKI